MDRSFRDKLFCFDAFGVLHDGKKLFSGVKEALIEYKKFGKVAILTNATAPSKVIVEQLSQKGLTKDFYDKIISLSARAAQAGVNPKHLNEFDLPLPSLDEQSKIVEELDNYLQKKYDVIFVDIKAIMQDGLDKDYLLSFRKKINTNICLFSGMDQIFTHLKNSKVSGAEIIDLLQPKLIYFVNLFKDYNIYQLSPNNLDRLRSTFFSLGYSNIKYDLKHH